MAVLKGCSSSIGNSSKVESLISVKELVVLKESLLKICPTLITSLLLFLFRQCSLFLSSSYFRGFVFVLMKWNWIAVLGTYSIFAFSFSFSSSLYSWQSCCYVPFYLFDINRFLLSIEGVNFYFPSFLIEFSMSFFLVSYYWHFVDWIWFLVFLFFLLILILINFLILYI